jgi:hypothetical protein
MSVSVTELFTEHAVVVVDPAAGPVVTVPATTQPATTQPAAMQPTTASPVEDERPEDPWYDGLTFSGPLDPAGTLFAFLLALVATVGVVVMVAAVVRMVSAG